MSNTKSERSIDVTNRYPGEIAMASAPLPTARTVRLRTFLPYQAYRFARVNMRMIKMIRRSHTT